MMEKRPGAEAQLGMDVPVHFFPVLPVTASDGSWRGFCRCQSCGISVRFLPPVAHFQPPPVGGAVGTVVSAAQADAGASRLNSCRSLCWDSDFVAV